MRIGHGIDIHPVSDDPGRTLVLGCVTFEGAAGLAGHSDADAVVHACIDAILGAARLGDIGMLFPDTDPAFAGVNSARLLQETVEQVTAAGWRIANIDCTVVLEAPKLAPHREEMQRRVGALVGAPVSVKATRAEGLGALGRAEGVVCTAVALLQSDPTLPNQEVVR